MPTQFTVKMISMILALFAGYSFPLSASAHEKDLGRCEQRLTGQETRAVQVRLAAELSLRGVNWVRLHEERGEVLAVAIDKYNGDALIYSPNLSSEPIGGADHLTVWTERTPYWVEVDGEKRLVVGGQALALDSTVPSRVRIMPVGFWADENTAGLPEEARRWTGMSVHRERDEEGHEVIVFISGDNELFAVYPDGAYPTIKLRLASTTVRNAQVLKSPNGSLLILVGRNESASILELKRGVVSPVAVVKNSFLFNAENQGPFVAWSGVDATSGAPRLNISRLDTLTSPQTSFPLENGETIKDYDVLGSVSESTTLAVLTNRRLFLFSLTGAELNGDQRE